MNAPTNVTEDQMRARQQALADLGVPTEALPRHIAIVMDGNGRWAQQRGEPRIYGHHHGAKSVRIVIEQCAKLGIEAVTLYSFSSENWSRPRDEVQALMMLAAEHLESERATLIENNIRFVQIGRREGLPPEVLDGLDGMTAATAHCTGLTLVLALNYGSRNEIVDAVQAIAHQVSAGQITADQIDEQRISDHLGTAGIVDPDLLIRTAGEMRLSNFLLWQISYAELHVTPTLWPDFDVEQLHRAIRDFASRRRRFGGLSTGSSAK
ncbi:MAG: di-trans,poly-cis-decaprenylcistransferase [Planctomycetaceae bacterium]|nr:di-trans,poly-cis-decaprenylcistransferase [Planctomycetaceae bacterium]